MGDLIAYERRGSGPPLVLIHPLGADRSVWAPVLPLLAPDRDVIAIDLPGFGESPPICVDAPSPRVLAGAVIELLARLNLARGRAHLAGNSLGGWVALEAAADGHAATVTAIAPAGMWSEPLGPKPALGRALARIVAPVAGPAFRSTRIRRLALAGSVGRPEAVPPEDAARLVRAYARGPGFRAVNREMRAGMFARMASIRVPVTLLWPELDRLIERPRVQPPSVRELELRGCGHIPMWDDPPAVAAALLAGSSRGGTGAPSR